MAAYNPNTNNLGFGGSPVSGITQFGGVNDWTEPATDKAAQAVASAQSALKGTSNAATPAVTAAPATTTPATTPPIDYSTYGGRLGETPGNMFSPQYSASGTPLPGSIAAVLARTTPAATTPVTPSPEQAAATQAYYDQAAAAARAYAGFALTPAGMGAEDYANQARIFGEHNAAQIRSPEWFAAQLQAEEPYGIYTGPNP